MIVKAQAPNRVLDFGGWTDTWFAGSGSVLNFAVSLYAQVIIATRARPGVSIRAQDFGEIIDIAEPGAEPYNGKHDLLKAAVNVMGIDKLDAYVYADVPAGCGTGSSAAISVALIGALSMLTGEYHRPEQIARLAHELETKELGIQSGVQDQIAAATGGIGYHTIAPYPHFTTSLVRVTPETAWELESRLLLVYTGERHLSGAVHEKVIADYQAGKPGTRKAMDTLKTTPQLAASALWKADFVKFAEIMNLNNAAQKALHAEITTEHIERIEEVARPAGAIGFKINGAGGGGSVTVLCDTRRRRDVEEAIRGAGFQLLPCRFDWDGLRTWVALR
jgi:D-glycero-alpha-D-manno-heptose-7-phosphate kinase